MPQGGLSRAVVSYTTLDMTNHLTLAKWLKDNEITRADFARRCEYDPSNLTKLLDGRIKPSLEVAAKIDRLTDGAVPMAGWVESQTGEAA
jgi:predicted transcriptional regulator